ncbi:hypothetical protein OAN96_00960, partial [Candidatus Gracilibacteria bacterium]|nr:hypothetical protein [Candidatus Gracilibacteria bacterium]
ATIYKKGIKLAQVGTKIKVIFFEGRNHTLTKATKEKIRNKIKENTDSSYDTFHCGDNQEEINYIKSIVFSSNNIQHIEYRSGVIEKSFLHKLEILNRYIRANKINKNTICVVGSGSLGVFGINHVSDIDIIQKEITNQGVIQQGEIDILDYKYYEKKSNKEIIEDNRFHFYFRGFKFINLRLLREVKALQGHRTKDINQANKIKVFLEQHDTGASKMHNITFELYYIKNLIKVYFLNTIIYITKKIGIYKQLSYFWRKYFLKNIK